jgi:hypothetical protein
MGAWEKSEIQASTNFNQLRAFPQPLKIPTLKQEQRSGTTQEDLIHLLLTHPSKKSDSYYQAQKVAMQIHLSHQIKLINDKPSENSR